MSNNSFLQVGYGLSQALQNVFPAPILANRAPTAADIKYPLGQVWIQKATAIYMLESVAAGAATWINFAGGAGVFSSLVVNPGPTSLSTVGNGAVTIGNATNTGALTISVGSGNFALNGNGNTVGIANDAAANLVTVGSTSGAASLTLQGGTAGISGVTSATGTISFGSAAMTGTMTFGLSTAGQTINIGNGVNVGAQVINIAAGASGANSTVNILSGNATAGVQTLNLLSGTQAGAFNLGTGAAAANTITIGGTGANVIAIGNTQTAGSFAVGNAMTTGTIALGGAPMTGTITIGQSTAAAGQTINIGNTAAAAGQAINIGAGAGPNVIAVGSLTGAASLALKAGTGGLSLQGGTVGSISMVPVTSSTASATNTVTMNNRVGSATFTGFTTAAAGKQAFVITNNTVLATSAIFCTVSNVHNANDAQMTLNSVVIAAAGGSFTVNTQNNGAGALDGNIIINFWVIS